MQVDLSSLPSNRAALKKLIAIQRAQIIEQESLVAQRDHLIAEHLQALAKTEHELARKDQELLSANALAEKLKFEIARYRRWRFGQKSEALGAEQIALWEAELDADIEALQKRLQDLKQSAGDKKPRDKGTPRREVLPAHLPRLEVRIEPDSTTCGCGQAMVRIGEDSAESLEVIPSRFWVKRTLRGKWACRCCETIAMAPVPQTAIEKSIAGTSVIANVIISKFADHVPLHRQERIWGRMGFAIPRSTMAGWIGRIGVQAEPLTDLVAQHVVARNALQADETPVAVLQPGTGKTGTGYLWVYRTLPSDPLQGVVFDFAMSRAQAHPNRMLREFAGTLQVDGYAGYNDILRRDTVIEAGCLAHLRRKFVDVFQATHSPIAQEAVTRIAALYHLERVFDDTVPDGSVLDRQRWRQTHAAPLLHALREWLLATHARMPPRSALANAIRYALNRWAAITRYADDGRLPLDTNAVENSIRPVALGRRNWSFAGSEAGGRRAAQMYTLISSASMNGHEPLAYLTDILHRLPTARMRDLEAMLPWNWQPPNGIDVAAALDRLPEPLIITAN